MRRPDFSYIIFIMSFLFEVGNVNVSDFQLSENEITFINSFNTETKMLEVLNEEVI